MSAHAAFDKACGMLDMYLRKVPVDPITQKVDIKQMRRLICRSTCVLVGSAPQFPHGSIDDIEEIGKLGMQYGIPVHVDACLGIVFRTQSIVFFLCVIKYPSMSHG